MNDAAIRPICLELKKRYHSADPYVIAEEKRITVLERGDFKRQKGAFMVIAGNDFIFLNGNLSEPMQRAVCAHELGHALLHRDLCRGGFLEYELFNMADRREYEANVFAAELLLKDREILEMARSGRDVTQMAQLLNVNVNLVLIKLNQMNRRGYEFRLPRTVKNDFLGSAEDGVGL